MKGAYRKVSCMMWGSADFRALSAPKPSARYLWLYLLTGRHTTALPGLWNLSRLHAADELRWTTADFDRAWDEISSRGMAAADWDAQVIWLPKVIEHNHPESPNVVRSWSKHAATVTDCQIKYDALTMLKGFAEGFGEAFAEAFDEAFPEGLPKDFPESVAVTVAVTGTVKEKRGADAPTAVAGPSPSDVQSFHGQVLTILGKADHQLRLTDKRKAKVRRRWRELEKVTTDPVTGLLGAVLAFSRSEWHSVNGYTDPYEYVMRSPEKVDEWLEKARKAGITAGDVKGALECK